LRKVHVFRAEFRDAFSTLAHGDIQTDSMNIAHFYVRKNWALLEKHIREAGGKDGVKATIAKKYY